MPCNTQLPTAIAILDGLIAFLTVSVDRILTLIDYAAARLAGEGQPN